MKKAQIRILALMLGITIIILALALAPSIKTFTDDAMNSSTSTTLGMDCSNSSISNFDKAACIGVDMGGFYFLAAIIFIGGSVAVAKVLLS